MKGKLIKKDNVYYLSHDFKDLGSTEDCGLLGKLSLKNCQAIENGYDLDELAEKEYLLHENNEELFGDSPDLISAYKAGVWDGLKRMVEILDNKKFSEDDVVEILKLYSNHIQINFEPKGTIQEPNDFTQSLQQTQWYVEIVTEKITAYTEDGLDYKKIKPKLDSNGCLILKRI